MDQTCPLDLVAQIAQPVCSIVLTKSPAATVDATIVKRLPIHTEKMPSTVPVEPKLIRWAITRSGLTEDELREKFKKLDEWISGDRQPTFRQLEEFARKTMTPFGFLFLKEPPVEDLKIPDFRTVGDTPIKRLSPNLIETMQTMKSRQEWMKDLLLDDDQQELDFVGSAANSKNHKTVAQKIRQTLELAPNWAESAGNWEDALQLLRGSIEQAGILVFSNSVVGLNNTRPLDPEEFRGFVFCDPYAPLIFVNSADSKSAQMFTLAHELAHIWLGVDGLFNLVRMLPHSDKTERFCNKVAAEFLVPEYKLRERWEEATATNKPFVKIGKWFKVSPVVAARRALDLKLIGQVTFFRFYEENQKQWQKVKRERKKKPGGNFYATQDSRLSRRFTSTVVRATREGRMLYRDAYKLTGLRGDTYSKFAGHVLNRIRNERQ